nr:ankyrin repeat-containing protein At5g02620-like [Ziziphus jujuba var. spinosa]
MDPQLYRAAAYYDGTSFESFAMDADPTILPKETPQRNAILHVAALNKQAQIAEKILQLHSSLLYHTKSDGDTPFHIAARVGCLEIVQLLLNYGKSGSGEIEANQKATRMVNLTKDTVLHEAARNGNVDVVELLMEEDPGLALLMNVVMVEEMVNALHAAVLCLPRDIMEEVMRKCPSAVTEEDDLGYTPLHYAALVCRVEVIELFFTYDNSIAYRKK